MRMPAHSQSSLGMVYLIKNGDGYKIGHTQNLQRRLLELQTGTQLPLIVVYHRTTPESRRWERFLHRRFAQVRMQGEWYKLTEADIAWIKDLEELPPEVIRRKREVHPASPFHTLLARHGIERPIDLAKRARLSRQYAHLLWTGQRQISRKMARRIEEATSIPYEQLMAAEPPPRRAPRPCVPEDAAGSRGPLHGGGANPRGSDA
jgi:Meiotically up-regulated gene 113